MNLVYIQRAARSAAFINLCQVRRLFRLTWTRVLTGCRAAISAVSPRDRSIYANRAEMQRVMTNSYGSSVEEIARTLADIDARLAKPKRKHSAVSSPEVPTGVSIISEKTAPSAKKQEAPVLV